MQNSRKQQIFSGLVVLYLVAVGLNAFFLAQAFAMDAGLLWFHVGVGIALVAIGYLMSTKLVDHFWPGFRQQRKASK